MENVRYELKYCEGCGTLRLRVVSEDIRNCHVCEQLLERFRFPRKALARRQAESVRHRRKKLTAAVPLPVSVGAVAGGAQ